MQHLLDLWLRQHLLTDREAHSLRTTMKASPNRALCDMLGEGAAGARAFTTALWHWSSWAQAAPLLEMDVEAGAAWGALIKSSACCLQRREALGQTPRLRRNLAEGWEGIFFLTISTTSPSDGLIIIRTKASIDRRHLILVF